MKYTVLAIAVVALYGCSNKTELSQSGLIQSFHPTNDAYLDQRVDDEQPDNSELRILKHDRNGEQIAVLKTGSNFSRVVNFGDIAFVSVLDPKVMDGNFSLLRIDFQRGTISETGIRLFDDFVFSSDREWICFTYNDHELQLPSHPGLKSYFPVIYLQKIGTDEKYRYDKLDEMKVRPNIAEIELNDNAFTVSYFQDSPKPVRIGRIDLKTHIFQWIK